LLQVEILAEQAVVVVPETARLMAEFVERLAQRPVDAAKIVLATTLAAIDEGLDSVAGLISDADAAFQEAAAAAEAFLLQREAELDAAASALGSATTRALVVEEIRRAGRAAAGELVFDTLWAVGGGLVDPALAVLGSAADWLSDVGRR
jgi:hypothetical protein